MGLAAAWHFVDVFPRTILVEPDRLAAIYIVFILCYLPVEEHNPRNHRPFLPEWAWVRSDFIGDLGI